MGIARGINTVNENLVFGYDSGYGVASLVNSTRFYKGRPATNTILPGATWNGDGTNQTVGSKGYTIITDENLKYNGYETVLWTPGSSRNVYLNGNADISTSDNSTVWTFSCYMRYEDQTTPINSMLVYLYYPNSDGTGTGTVTDCGNGWYRVSRTRIGTSDNIGLAGFTGFVANKKIYLSGPMLTKTSTEVTYIGRSVTRSNTDSLIDLKRTTNMSVGNISFDSTGQPDYDGSDDFLTTTLTNINLNNGCAIEGVLRRNTTPTAWRTFFNVKHTSANTPFFEFRSGSNAQEIFADYYHPADYITPSATLATGDFGHAVACYDGNGNIKMYFNGSLVGTKTGVPSFKLGTSPRLTVGRAYDNSRNTDISAPIVRVYDATLSAAQVKQNYEAYKNRFNI